MEWDSATINAQLAAQRSAAPELLVPLDVALEWMADRYGLTPRSAIRPTTWAD